FVYFNDTDVGAERKGKRLWLPEDRRLQARLDTWMQRIRSMGCYRYLLKRDSFLWRTSYREFTILQRHISGAGLQHVSSDLFHLRLDPRASVEDGRAANRRSAAPIRAASFWRRVSIAIDDLHILYRDTKLTGNDLGKCRLLALPMWRSASIDHHG